MLLRVFYDKKLSKSQGTPKGQARHTTEQVPFFTTQITRKGPQKRIGMHIFFYVRAVI